MRNSYLQRTPKYWKEMNIATRIIALIIIALSLNACTHNNGDIGDLFGTWKLESITINGEMDASYAKSSNVIWKFQASVMSMIRTNDTTHDRSESWGTWSYANNETQLVLNFTHTDNNNTQPGSAKYSPLIETHLPKATISTLDIKELNGKKMILIYHSSDGVEYTYHFKRWV